MSPDPEPSGAAANLPAPGAQVRQLPSRVDMAKRERSSHAQRPGIVIAPPRYALAHALTRSLGQPLVSGNRIELLCGGDPAWAALFDAIDRAREHVNLESPGRVNPALAAALAQRLMARAAAGVRVNLLLDGSRPGAARDATVLRQAGVGVCTPHRWPHIAALATRTVARQRSLIVIDGRIGFLGGLAPPWAGTDRRGSCLRVEGPAVALLQELFVAGWQRERGETLPRSRYFPALRPQGRQRAALAVQEAGGPAAPFPRALLAAIEAARHHVLLAGAANPSVLDALADAAARGIEVQWLLPIGSDAGVVRFPHARLRALLDAGVRLQRRRHAPLHAEACVIDGVWATVGAAPLQPGHHGADGAHTALIVLDEGFGAGIERMLRDDIALGQELTAAGLDAEAAAEAGCDRGDATASAPASAWSRGWQWLAERFMPRAPGTGPAARR